MQNTPHRHRTSARQPDLFAAIFPPASDSTPAWSSLPDRTRQTVTCLMTRLLVGHVAGELPAVRSDADER